MADAVDASVLTQECACLEAMLDLRARDASVKQTRACDYSMRAIRDRCQRLLDRRGHFSFHCEEK
jgi:hypothetical protein